MKMEEQGLNCSQVKEAKSISVAALHLPKTLAQAYCPFVCTVAKHLSERDGGQVRLPNKVHFPKSILNIFKPG